MNYVHWKDVKFVDNMEYGLFSFSAHEMGLKYQDVKTNTAILHFPGSAKPWTVNLIRYDIEKIWWEYLKKTPYYYDIMEQVFFDIFDSTIAEDTIKQLGDGNANLQKAVEGYQTILKKLGFE